MPPVVAVQEESSNTTFVRQEVPGSASGAMRKRRFPFRGKNSFSEFGSASPLSFHVKVLPLVWPTLRLTGSPIAKFPPAGWVVMAGKGGSVTLIVNGLCAENPLPPGFSHAMMVMGNTP